MKKLVSLILIITLSACLCACTNYKTLKTTKMITACFASGNNEYLFVIATPKSTDNENKDSSHRIYAIYASNFSNAIDELQSSLSNVDIAHISLFLADESYISDKFHYDSQYISQKLSISPMTKVFVIQTDPREFFYALSSNVSSSFSQYIDASFNNENKNILCTMPELIFASANSYYTASVPCIALLPESSLPKVNSAVFYNFKSGTNQMEKEDYTTYKNVINSFGKTSKPFKFSYSDGSLYVAMSDEIANREKVIGLARKYKEKDVDIFNSIYFSKKCFLTYSSYQKAIEKLVDIIFIGGKK